MGLRVPQGDGYNNGAGPNLPGSLRLCDWRLWTPIYTTVSPTNLLDCFLMARFSNTRTAAASIDAAWDALQDAGVWGGLLGASKISDIEHEDDGRLKSCEWTAKIGGSDLHGSFQVSESKIHERMKARIKAEEWKGTIEVKLEKEATDETVIHARLELQADGFTAMLALPVVAMIVGNHFPDRLDELVERIEGG